LTLVGALVGLITAIPSPGHADLSRPANDDFAAAAAIDSLLFTSTVANRLATSEAGEPRGCSTGTDASAAYSGASVWYRFTPSADMTVLLDTVGTDFRDTIVAVYTGSAVSTLTKVMCSWTASAPSSRLAATLTAGTPYSVQIASTSPTVSGRVSLNVEQAGGITGRVVDASGTPLSDVCVGATDDAGFRRGTTTKDGSYRITGLPGGSVRVTFGDCAYPSRFASLEYPTAVSITPGVDTALDAVTMRARPVVEGTVRDESGSAVARLCVELSSEQWWDYEYTDALGHFRFEVPQAGVYTLNVTCWSDARFEEQQFAVIVGPPGTSTRVDVTLRERITPPNDNFAAAIVASPDFTDRQPMERATLEVGEPSTCPLMTASVWYRFTPEQSGTVLLDATSDRMPPAVAAYEGTELGQLKELGCHDYGNNGSGNSQVPLLPISVEAGKTYSIQVGSDLPPIGTVTFRLNQVRPVGSLLHDQAATPCAAACPYWTSGSENPSPTSSAAKKEAACRPQPLSPPGSWQDHEVSVPETISGAMPRHLVWEFAPEMDYDGFVCRKTADPDGHYFVAIAANPLGSLCPSGTATGCPERAVALVHPNQALVLRIYNWADTKPVTSQYGYAA
jgi:hypothetical protein